MKASVLLLPLVLAEAFAGRVAYRKRVNSLAGRSNVQRKPNYSLGFANLRTVPNPFYYALRRSYDNSATNDATNVQETNQNQDSYGLEGYIPVTDGHGGTYLLLKSAIQDISPSNNPEPEPEPAMESEEDEEELLVPNGSFEILGGQVVDSKTGQNSFILPEEVLNDVGENDVLALVENPDDIAASRKFVIRRTRRKNFTPSSRTPSYYSQPNPYFEQSPYGNMLQFGPVQVITANGRRRIIFQ